MVNRLNKILRYPEKIPCDKRLHMLVGVAVAVVLLSLGANLVATSMVVIFVAWGIELGQKLTKSGTYDNWDAIAVVAGGLVVSAPYIIAEVVK